jgi:hypothetical protein
VSRGWSTLRADITGIANGPGLACPVREREDTPVSGGFFESAVPDDGYKPPDIDTSVAHQARVYDYLIGGKGNFAADCEVGDKALQAYPDSAVGSRANRAFLSLVVRFLTGEAGIRQFLDIGTGIPSANNTHEVAQGVAPEAQVVYMDNDQRRRPPVHREQPAVPQRHGDGRAAFNPLPGERARLTISAVGVDVLGEGGAEGLRGAWWGLSITVAATTLVLIRTLNASHPRAHLDGLAACRGAARAAYPRL